MTKCIVLGQEPKSEEKPIELVRYLDNICVEPTICSAITDPEIWKNLELIKKSDTGFYDLIYAYDKNRNEGCLYLGHWNSGKSRII